MGKLRAGLLIKVELVWALVAVADGSKLRFVQRLHVCDDGMASNIAKAITFELIFDLLILGATAVLITFLTHPT